ncbi:MAG: hypothetical protein P4N59_26995 [Negativicutes bacterium]|nr:hypothetical protein [Negativicutes bacterium]
MRFIRWYGGPILVGFLLSAMINPMMAGLGLLVWLALIIYIIQRWPGRQEY